MVIKRILTNNAVVIDNDNGKEEIVCGKGIAFKKKRGDSIDYSQVNQIFVLKDSASIKGLEQIVKDVPLEYIKLASEINEMAKREFGKEFSDNMIVSLSDHLYTAIKRHKEGLQIKNSLLWDIKNFYENEYRIGLESLNIIKERLHIELPEDEAGFIALHIVNATLEGSNIDSVMKTTVLIQEITTIISYHFHITFDKESIYYNRFITHLKFFSIRLFNKTTYDLEDNNNFLKIVIDQYPNVYKCALKISNLLNRKYHYDLKDEELLYLMIHIQRIISKTEEGGEI